MRLFALFCFLLVANLSIRGQALENKHILEFKVENSTLPEAIRKLIWQTKEPICLESDSGTLRSVSVELQKASIPEILDRLSQTQAGYHWDYSNRIYHVYDSALRAKPRYPLNILIRELIIEKRSPVEMIFGMFKKASTVPVMGLGRLTPGNTTYEQKTDLHLKRITTLDVLDHFASETRSYWVLAAGHGQFEGGYFLSFSGEVRSESMKSPLTEAQELEGKAVLDRRIEVVLPSGGEITLNDLMKQIGSIWSIRWVIEDPRVAGWKLKKLPTSPTTLRQILEQVRDEIGSGKVEKNLYFGYEVDRGALWIGEFVKELSFKEVSFRQVVKTLSEEFQISIDSAGVDLSRLPLVTLKPMEDLKWFLDYLCNSRTVDYDVENGTIRLKTWESEPKFIVITDPVIDSDAPRGNATTEDKLRHNN